MPHYHNGKPIILTRRGFQQLFQHSNQCEPLRNQLIIDFPTQMGLRNREIRLLQKNDIDASRGQITIQNSKNKHLYPIPLNYLVAQKLEQYQKQSLLSPSSDFVLNRLLGSSYSYKKQDSPLTKRAIIKVWHSVAYRAGIRDWQLYTPHLGRHYFAAISTYHPDPQKRLGLETLRRILRHKSLAYTQIYLSRLVFFEDIQADYNRIHNVPALESEKKMYPEDLEFETAEPVPSREPEFCRECIHYALCQETGLCHKLGAWATSCKHFKPKIQVEGR